MTDNVDHLKAAACSLSNASNEMGYSYSQVLELYAKAVAGFYSWNHFTAELPGKIKSDLTIPLLLLSQSKLIIVALRLLGSNPSAKLLKQDSTQLIDDLKQLWQYEEPEAFSP